VLGDAHAVVGDDEPPLVGALRTGDRAHRARSGVANRAQDKVLDHHLEHPRAGPSGRTAFRTRFSTTTWSIRARSGSSNDAVHSIRSSTPAAPARSATSAATRSITGNARIEPSATTARPLSSTLRKR